MDRRIDVVYGALLGWMSIEVDGERRKRGWREWQTVFGGANLACEVNGRRLAARVTQPFGRQVYSFALRIDGELQPGSDPQPEPGKLKRQTLIRIIAWPFLVSGVLIALAVVARVIDRLI